MSELEEFLAHTLQRHAQATTGVRNGDATALIEMLSTRDLVTLFPASQPAQQGWARPAGHGKADSCWNLLHGKLPGTSVAGSDQRPHLARGGDDDAGPARPLGRGPAVAPHGC
jgi:hypothetical protein